MACFFVRTGKDNIVEQYIKDIYNKGEKAGYKVNINAVWSFKKKELSFGDLYLIYNPLVPTMFTYLLYWAFKFNLRHRYKYKGDIQRYTKNMGILTLEGMY